MEKFDGLNGGFLSLPAETTVCILSFVDYKSLLACACTCKRLRQIAGDENLWRRHCKYIFLLDKCNNGQSWRESFRSHFLEYGKYIHCYSSIKQAWDQIEQYFIANYGPEHPFLKSLNGPASEAMIESAERRIGHQLPYDLRCYLRIHNGQGTFSSNAGFLNYYLYAATPRKAEYLLDIATIAEKHQREGEFQGCVPITYGSFSLFNGNQFLVVTEEGGHAVGEVFVPVERREGFKTVDQFISGKSFTQWFTQLAKDISNGCYLWQNERLFMLEHDPNCVAVTRGMYTTKVATAFMFDHSSAIPAHFHYTYYITISMDKAAPASYSCQLETRHWVITDEDGLEETVDGPGVVGEFPVLRPGTEYSWRSYTSFITTYGNMRGHFTMKNIHTGEKFNIECPVFHLKCPPYKLSEERAIKRRERKKRL